MSSASAASSVVATPAVRAAASSRKPYIDWLRGVAVAIMIEAHTIDSWIHAADKATAPYQYLVFLAGWAAPLFLFLAGVAVPLAGASRIRRGATLRAAGWKLQVRGWQVFALGFAFRVYSFMLAPGKSWAGTFNPDILNVMGLALVGVAFCWSRRDTLTARILWLFAPVALIVVCAPLSVGWAWPAHLSPSTEAYIRVNGSGTFALLPWAAFVFAGAIVGTLLVPARSADADRAFQLRLAMAGAVMLAAGYAGSFLPAPLPHSSFWTTSISWFVIRAGVIVLAMPLSWLWFRRPTSTHWSPMVLFGQTSLFVYWIHIELVYGFFTYPLRGELSIWSWLLAFVLFTSLMVGAALLWSRRRVDAPWIPPRLIPDSRRSTYSPSTVQS